MRRYGLAVLGGTFDRLHLGHAALLGTALAVGRSVAIGLTTPAYLRAHPKPDGPRIQLYSVRRRSLEAWLRRHATARRWRVVPLENPFGRSTEEGVGVLVVSADTRGGGAAVNRERRRLGRRPVPVVVVPLVLADDLRPISSRRIRAREIDRWGRRRSPIAVGLEVGAEDRVAAVRAVRSAFPRARVSLRPPARGGRAPPGRATAGHAAARAQRGRDLGVGVLRSGPGRWWIAERSDSVALAPRSVRGDLEGGLLRLLRPSAAKKEF